MAKEYTPVNKDGSRPRNEATRIFDEWQSKNCYIP